MNFTAPPDKKPRESTGGSASHSPEPRDSRASWISKWLFWPIVLLGAISIRIALVAPKQVIDVDGAYYASLAKAFAHGDWMLGLSTAWPPLYPFLIALTSFVLPLGTGLSDPARFELAGRLVSAVLGTLLLIPLYRLALRFFPTDWACVATLLVAFHPRLVHYSTTVLTEMIYTVLIIGGISALAACWPKIGGTHAEDETQTGPSVKWDLVAGVCFGLAFLTRPEALLIAVALWLGALIQSRRKSGWQRSRLGIVVGTLLIAGPFLIFLHGELGRWSLGEKGPFNFYRTFASEYEQIYPAPIRLSDRIMESPELAREIPPQSVEAVGFVVQRPKVFFGATLERLIGIVFSTLPVTVYHLFAVFVLLGLWGARSGPWWLVSLPLIAIPLLYSPLSEDRRFFVPLIPLLILFSVQGMRNTEAWFARRRKSPVGARAVMVPAVVLLLVYSISYTLWKELRVADAVGQRQAGEWLADNWSAPMGSGLGEKPNTSRPIVMSVKPWVGYYASGLIVPVRDMSVEDLLTVAREKNVDVLAVDERSATSTRPKLFPLLDPNNAPADLTVLHIVESPKRVVLYSVAEKPAAEAP